MVLLQKPDLPEESVDHYLAILADTDHSLRYEKGLIENRA